MVRQGQHAHARETVTDQSVSPRTQAAGTPALSASPLTGTGLSFQTSTCTMLPASKVLVLTQVRWGPRLHIPLRRCWYSRLFQDEAAGRSQSVQRPNHLPSGGMRNGTPALHRKSDQMTSKSPPGVRDKDAKVQHSGLEKRGSCPPSAPSDTCFPQRFPQCRPLTRETRGTQAA